jgi:hypothetical protein
MTKVSKIYGGYTGDDALIRLSKELKLEEKWKKWIKKNY